MAKKKRKRTQKTNSSTVENDIKAFVVITFIDIVLALFLIIPHLQQLNGNTAALIGVDYFFCIVILNAAIVTAFAFLETKKELLDE